MCENNHCLDLKS